MESKYFHSQRGTLILIAMLIGICFTSITTLLVFFAIGKASGDEQARNIGAFIAMSTTTVLLLCTWLFHKLTVEITDDHLKFWFGPGLINKTIVLAEILTAKAVRTTIADGWGIHYHGNGWDL